MKEEKEGGVNGGEGCGEYKSDEKGDWYEACESSQRRFEQKIETKSLER